ncbi:MAG: PocR ligand-binding domain-containing protein [Spirochaetes bacterium]|nr:PocR ligand-binding domain-containing protein [Spirochaetota bacterium]
MNDVMSFEAVAASPVYRRFFHQVSDLMGVSVRLIDPSGKLHMHHPRRDRAPFVCDVIRSSPKINAQCIACDKKHAALSVMRRKGFPYRCHAGLYDIVVPLFDRGVHVATLITGQLLAQPRSDRYFGAIRRRFSDVHAPESQLRAAFRNSHYLTPRQRKAFVDMLALFCEHVIEVRFQIMDASRSRERLEIASAKEYIRKHLDTPLYLADVARELGLSPAYFSSIFKKETGESFVEYVNRARIHEASRMLSATSAAVIEAAHACGISSLSNFNRLFRKYNKCTPKSYIRQRAG